MAFRGLQIGITNILDAMSRKRIPSNYGKYFEFRQCRQLGRCLQYGMKGIDIDVTFLGKNICINFNRKIVIRSFTVNH